MNDDIFVKIFGGIDEKYIREANEDMNFWLESQEGEVVRADGSRRFPWRTFIASVACTAAVVVGAVFLTRNVMRNGFVLEPASSTDNPAWGGESSRESTPLDESSVSSVPDDEIAFLIGPDGKAIRKSEITYLINTPKTVETLTEDDIGADVYCEGFAYYKLPCGVGYDSYKNPELFNGSDFLGEVPENTNVWKRVNVGDEICGLKVKSATAHFTVSGNDSSSVPEHHFHYDDIGIELEGTVEAEGFLRVYNPIDDFSAFSEEIWFYPSAIDLPLTPEFFDMENGFETKWEVRKIHEVDKDLFYAGEYDYIILGRYSDVDCDMDGLNVGEVAYARVTFGNMRCLGSKVLSATPEKVELLSGILAKEIPT